MNINYLSLLFKGLILDSSGTSYTAELWEFSFLSDLLLRQKSMTKKDKEKAKNAFSE